MIAVTKLIDILNKPALVYWANKIGLQGVRLSDYYKRTQNDGNKKHNDVELYFTDGVEFDGVEKLRNNLKGYEVIGVEKSVTNDFLNGRIDLILKKNGLTYVVDFKRNKSIYLNTKLQLSTYKHMINADKICYINFEDYKLIEIDIDTNKYYEIIKRLYQVYILLNNLNEKL